MTRLRLFDSRSPTPDSRLPPEERAAMKRAALVIGCSHRGSADFRALEGVDNDLSDVHGFFKFVAKYDRVHRLYDLRKDQILQALDLTLGELSPQDLLVVYFAGHGHLVNGQHVLLCNGARMHLLEDFHEAIPVRQLRRMTDAAGLNRVLLLDCCRNSPYAASAREAAPQGLHGEQALRDVVMATGVRPVQGMEGVTAAGSFTMLCGCSEDQVAAEVPALQRGLFTTAMLETMEAMARARGAVRVDDDLRDAIERRMDELIREHGLPYRPRPWKAGDGTPPAIIEVGEAVAATAPTGATVKPKAKRKIKKKKVKKKPVAAPAAEAPPQPPAPVKNPADADAIVLDDIFADLELVLPKPTTPAPPAKKPTPPPSPPSSSQVIALDDSGLELTLEPDADFELPPLEGDSGEFELTLDEKDDDSEFELTLDADDGDLQLTLDDTDPNAKLVNICGEWVVAADGSGDARTIREVLAFALAGDEIRVRPGTYTESLVLDKKVEIRGDGQADRVVIQSATGDCIRMATDEASVRGITIRCVGKGERHAVNVPRGRLVLEDCNLSSEAFACIAIHGKDANPTIRKCRIRQSHDCGILVYDQGRGVIEDCDVYGTSLAGLEIHGGGDPTVRRCQIHDGKSSGIYVHTGGKGTLEDCHLQGHTLAGIEVRDLGGPVAKRCRVTHNERSGIWVDAEGGGTFEDCEVQDNGRAGIEVLRGSEPRFVRCHVLAGLKYGVLVADKAAGTFEECEVSRCGASGVEIRESAKPVLRGCKIHACKLNGVRVHSGGAGRLEKCFIHGHWRSGVCVSQGGMPLMFHCVVRDCQESGVLVYDHAVGGGMIGCEVYGNGFSGVEIREGSEFALTDCKIRFGKGGGVLADLQGQATVEDCHVEGNALAAVEVRRGGELHVVRSTLAWKDGSPVRVHGGGKATIEECKVSSNPSVPLFDCEDGSELRQERNVEYHDGATIVG
jgi:F-box protein 11